MSRDSDPGRLLETSPDSPLGQMLGSAQRDVPSDQALAELAQRLGAVLEPAPPPPSPGSAVLVRVGVGIGVAALIVGGIWASRRPAAVSTSPNVVSSVPVATAPAPELAVPVVNVDPTTSTSAPGAGAAPSAVTPSQPKAESPKAVAQGPSEAALLEQARRALTSSPASALALTNQDAARFPHGVLAQEREVIAIEALRRLGRSSEADRRAAAFAQAYPGSAHQRMVEDASPR